MGYKNVTSVKVDGNIYAANIVLLTETKETMEKLVEVWVEEIERRTMEINVNKCETKHKLNQGR